MEMSAASISTRQAFLTLLYEGKDISAQIAPYVLSFSFTDNAHGKADDLQVTLEDRDHVWKGDWYPDKGATLTASLRCEQWDAADALPVIMRCGTFTIDEIELSGAPDTVTIKAVSAAMTKSLRQQRKTKAWENSSLEQAARDIADAHGLTLRYHGPEFTFTRMDQRETSDLGFLKRMAEQRGMLLKVAEDSLILISGKGYDAKSPAKTLTRGVSPIKSFRFKEKTDGVYGDGAEVNYHDPVTKQGRNYAFDNALSGERQSYVKDPKSKKKGGDRLKVNRRLDANEDGLEIVKAEARGKNKDEFEGSLSLMGDPDLRAAMTVAVVGFKRFDAVYFIETATHSFDRSSGYATELKIRKTLDY
ncbi:phage late control D family protein [Solidesulfovibrio sp.]